MVENQRDLCLFLDLANANFSPSKMKPSWALFRLNRLRLHKFHNHREFFAVQQHQWFLLHSYQTAQKPPGMLDTENWLFLSQSHVSFQNWIMTKFRYIDIGDSFWMLVTNGRTATNISKLSSTNFVANIDVASKFVSYLSISQNCVTVFIDWRTWTFETLRWFSPFFTLKILSCPTT